MNTLDTPEILRKYIRNANDQRRLMEPWHDDKKFKDTGGKVAYAVDTDVITLFTNPAEKSIPQPQRPYGYATIFHNDDTELSIAFGQSLAKYIFTELGPGGDPGPLMVMPSLEAELGRVFAAVARDASRSENAARDQLKKLREAADDLKPFEGQPDKLAEELKKRAPDMEAILRGTRGPHAQLRRFSRLFSKERIAGLDFLAERNEWYDAEFRALFPAIANIPDLDRLNRLTGDWLEALKKTKALTKPKEKVEDDAQALARLQWMNEKIDSKRFRIVFITGDEAISKAAAERPGGTESENFQDSYIRNPRAFMADSRALFPWANSKRRAHDLAAFLDLFLADYCPRPPRDKRLGAAHHDGVLEEREDRLIDTWCRTALKRSPNMVTDFREKWKDFTLDVKTRAIPHNLTARALGIDADGVGDIGKIMDQVDRTLQQRIDDAWSACFDAATLSGFDILSSAKKGNSTSELQYQPRNAPPLYFDRFKKTREFVQSLLSTAGKVNPQGYQEKLDMLREEDAGIGYLFNLAFAMLFASMGRWPLTAILADRALQKAGESGDKRFSGREANYLKAITLRHTARKADDLDKIDGLIGNALACLEKDKKHHQKLEVWPIRFEIERTSTDLASSLFAIFDKSGSQNNLQSLEEIQTAFQNHIKQLPDMKPKSDSSWIYLNIERNLLTNIFMTALLRVFKHEEFVDTAAMASLFKRFESNVNDGDGSDQKIGISYLVNVVYSVSKIWLGHGSKAFVQETLMLLSDHKIVDASVMAYDKQRFEFLRGIVENRSRFREPR